MDRVSWIGVVVCILLLVFYPSISKQFFPQQAVPRQPATQESATDEINVAIASTEETPVLQSYSGEIRKEADLPEEKKVTLSNDYITAEFTNHGGAISRIILKKHASEGDERVELNRGYTVPMLNLTGWTGKFTLIGYELVAQNSHYITFARDIDEHLRLVRKYTLSDDYSIKLEQTIQNTNTQDAQINSYSLQVGVGAPVHLDDSKIIQRYVGGSWYTMGQKYKSHKLTEFNDGGFLFFKTKGKSFVHSGSDEKIRWASTRSQFFATILESATTPAVGVDLRKVKLTEVRTKGDNIPDAVQARLEMPAIEVPAGSSVKQEFHLYAGPKKDSLLRKLPFEQDKVMEFGWLGFISRPLLMVMTFINKYIHNYGITIILLTILIKAALWIPQTKSNLSMKRMQLLSPKLKELQDKYKDNPQRLQDEMMKLYRDYNVNPLGGCLPLLVQMPIFIGFYYMLLSAVELRHASFLWISDLSQPDTVVSLPVLGFSLPINPMPLIMGATMFWSMNITPQVKTGDNNSTMKMMKFMPLLILAICYNFSAALSLYWTVQNILSVGQMYYNNSQPMPKLEKVHHTTDDVKAKAAKKAKGKGFFETLHAAQQEAQKQAQKKRKKK